MTEDLAFTPLGGEKLSSSQRPKPENAEQGISLVDVVAPGAVDRNHYTDFARAFGPRWHLAVDGSATEFH